ncbi:MAG: lipoate--protein ligase family protein, partial [Gammaproteobacteria bacterium]|nr:lipoate--protein ligase family protein [Gammaproteobacteria bacterium]
MRDAVLWDTGLRSGACNLAFDRCQRARTRCAGLTILRLHRSHPTASIGAHEAAHQSLRLSYCRRRGLAVVRRLTGGGAYYLDRAQLGWTLTAVPREVGATLAEVLERAGRGVARGLRTLGVEAASPAPDVVEVAGRKLGAVCARLDAGVVTAQGTLLVDVDVETMLKVLRVPREKLTPEGVAGARQRLVTLNEL